MLKNFNLLSEIKNMIQSEIEKANFDPTQVDLLFDYFDYVRSEVSNTVKTFEQWLGELNNMQVAA